MRLPRVGFRLGLRGVAGIIALLEVLLAVSRPFWREPLEFAAKWVWADFYRHDIVRLTWKNPNGDGLGNFPALIFQGDQIRK